MSNEINSFNDSFEDDILDIAFVLKEGCRGAGKTNQSKYYILSIGAIACKNIHTNEIIESENLIIQKETEDTDYYFKIFREKTIVRLKVRKKKNNDNIYTRFLLEDIIDTDYKDDDLDIILKKYLEPVYYKDELLGKFKLYKSMNIFEKKIVWTDKKEIFVSFGNMGNEDNKQCIDIIKNLLNSKEDIDQKVKDYAAENMLDDANIWNDDTDKPILKKEDFIKLIKFESINIYDDTIEFYLDDGDIFSGHIIIVSSDWDLNFTHAYIAG